MSYQPSFSSSVQPPTQSNKTKIKSMSGKWRGFSKTADESKPPTEWANTEIRFNENNENHGDPNILMISGKGASLFQGEEIHFHLVGKVDTRTTAFELYKTHTGKFTHTLVYRGLIDLDTYTLSGSFVAGNVAGRLELKFERPSVPAHLDINRSKHPGDGLISSASADSHASFAAAAASTAAPPSKVQQVAVPNPSDIYIALDFDQTLTDSHSGGYAMTQYLTQKSDMSPIFDMSILEKGMFRSKITEWAGKGYTTIILTRSIDSEIYAYLKEIFVDIMNYFTILAPTAELFNLYLNDNMFWANWKRDTLHRYLSDKPNAKAIFVDDTKVNVDVMQSLPNVVSEHKPFGISYEETYIKVEKFLENPDKAFQLKPRFYGGRTKKYKRTPHKKRGATKRGAKRSTKRGAKRSTKRNIRRRH